MNYKKGTQTRGCMKSVMRYVSQPGTTFWDGQNLVSGIGCQPETAFDEFLSTKLLHHTQAANLIREDDEVVYGDSGYLGVQKRPEIAGSEHFSKIDFRINRRPSSLPKVSDNAIDWERYIENRKSAVRCKVEHAFRIIKCQFGYKKTVYRGLKKNENRLYAMFACANLYALAIAGRKLATT